MRKITPLDMTTFSVVKPKQKVAAYIRVSTSNEDQLISLEAQRSINVKIRMYNCDCLRMSESIGFDHSHLIVSVHS